jgi:hypothetical protein
MIALRLLLLMTALAVTVCAAGYLLGGDRKYLRWAVKILKVGGVVALVFFGVLIIERI